MSKTRVVDTRDWVSHIARARPSPPSSLPRYFIPAIIIIIITLRSVGIPHTRMIAPVRRLCTKTVRTCPPVRRISMIGRDNNKIYGKAYGKVILEMIELFQYIEMLQRESRQLSAIGI